MTWLRRSERVCEKPWFQEGFQGLVMLLEQGALTGEGLAEGI